MMSLSKLLGNWVISKSPHPLFLRRVANSVAGHEVKNEQVKKTLLGEIDRQRKEVDYAKEHENDWADRHNENVRRKRQEECY